tara:strand:+ start:2295 stop:2558 length:264 start_codon:yes stop_codon:yes gene_type:complete
MDWDSSKYGVGQIVETDMVIDGITEKVGGEILDTRNFHNLEEAQIFVDWFTGEKGWYYIWDDEEIVGYNILIRPSNIVRVYHRDYEE